jgi:hypothetical protein
MVLVGAHRAIKSDLESFEGGSKSQKLCFVVSATFSVFYIFMPTSFSLPMRAMGITFKVEKGCSLWVEREW